MPKLRDVKVGTKTKIYCQETDMSEMRPGSATDRQIGPDYGWKSSKTTEVFWKKSCISYQFRADVQTYGYQPQYMADNDAADTDMCTQKCQVAATSMIKEMRSSSE